MARDKKTMFNRYQTFKHPSTGTEIVVKTDNTLGTALGGSEPWRYIDKAGMRFRPVGDGTYEIQKFDDRGGGYFPYKDLSDQVYWEDYIRSMENLLKTSPLKNWIQHTFGLKLGGYLMRQGGRIVEVPFNI